MKQREIKFRVWDPSEKYMSSGKALKDSFILAKEGGFYWDDSIILMQFTGAIDKNGKDIYEGDKVKHKYRRIWQTKEHISTVVWDESFFCYYLFDGQNYHRMRDDIIYEIIGNIYE